MNSTLTLNEKLDIVKKVGNPNLPPTTERELSIYMDMLKLSDLDTYYSIIRRFDVVDTTQNAVNMACKAFFDTIAKHFPEADQDASVHKQVMLRFESVAKLTVLNWVQRNYNASKRK